MLQFIICTLLAGFGGIAVADAKQHSGYPHIAYVSINETALKTGEQNKIRKTMAKEEQRIKKMIRKKTGQYKKQADKIRADMALLSEAEKAKQYEQLQKIELSMQQFVKEKDMAFQKKEADLKNTFINRIKVVVAAVAKKDKIDVVRNKDTVFWVHPRWDITGKIVKAYKKKY